MTDKEIQNYIGTKRESFADLLVAPQFQKVNIDNPTYASPSDVLYKGLALNFASRSLEIVIISLEI